MQPSHMPLKDIGAKITNQRYSIDQTAVRWRELVCRAIHVYASKTSPASSHITINVAGLINLITFASDPLITDNWHLR